MTKNKEITIMGLIQGYASMIETPKKYEKVTEYSIRLTEGYENGSKLSFSKAKQGQIISAIDELAKGETDIFKMDELGDKYVENYLVGIGEKDFFCLYPSEVDKFLISNPQKNYELVPNAVQEHLKNYNEMLKVSIKVADSHFFTLLQQAKRDKDLTKFVVEVEQLNANVMFQLYDYLMKQYAEKAEMLIQTTLYDMALKDYQTNKKWLQPSMKYYHAMLGDYDKKTGKLKYELVFHLPFGKVKVIEKTIKTGLVWKMN